MRYLRAQNENNCPVFAAALTALVDPHVRRVYFPNLNGIRFVAAAVIFVDHVEWMKHLSQVPDYAGIPPSFGSATWA